MEKRSSTIGGAGLSCDPEHIILEKNMAGQSIPGTGNTRNKNTQPSQYWSICFLILAHPFLMVNPVSQDCLCGVYTMKHLRVWKSKSQAERTDVILYVFWFFWPQDLHSWYWTDGQVRVETGWRQGSKLGEAPGRGPTHLDPFPTLPP